jgi:acetyl-CoA carboxylase beta subunit
MNCPHCNNEIKKSDLKHTNGKCPYCNYNFKTPEQQATEKLAKYLK